MTRLLHILRGLAPTIVIVIAVVTSGYVDDRRSCERQQPIRGALHDYATSAANARLQSAALEAGHSHRQASIDIRAARQFLAIAGRVPQLDCSTIPAGK